MSEPLLRINPTRARRRGRCEYEWYVRDVLGVDPLRPPPSPHLDRGKAFHALLEYAFRCYADDGTIDVYDGDLGKFAARGVLSDLYRREGTSLDDAASYELLDATRYHLRRLDLPAWEVVRLADGTPVIELDLRAPVGLLVEAQAIVDVVLRHRATGKVWFVDFKTSLYALDTGDLPPFIEHDDQLALGRHVLAANGINVDYSALLHLRSVPPTPPPLVYVGKKNERTTYNTNDLACDWETYRETLIERGENPESDQALKVRDALRQRVFARWQLDITGPAGRDAVATNLSRIAARMTAIVRGDTKPIRRLSWGKHRGSCNHCDYGKWCRASLRNGGEPALVLLGTDYEARDTSPLAGREVYDAPLFDPTRAYVEWAAEHGRTIAPHEEFTP